MGEMKRPEERREDDGKFYERASARLAAALGERPTADEVRRLHEDAEAGYGETRLARRMPELERWRQGRY